MTRSQSVSNLRLCIPPRRLEIADQRPKAKSGGLAAGSVHTTPERPAGPALTCWNVCRFFVTLRKRAETRLAGWRRSADRASLQSISLQTGNFTGNFTNSGRHRQLGCPVGEQIQSLVAKFPTKPNRDFFEVEQGNLARDQGSLGPRVSVHFSHACSAADEHDLFSPSICRWRERDGGAASGVEAAGRGILAGTSRGVEA